MKNKALLASALFLMLLALIQLIRVFYPFQVSIAGFSIPFWFSAILFVFFGAFSAWMFYALGKKES